MNYNPKNWNLKSNSKANDMWIYQNMIESLALITQHVKECVCVCALYAKVCKLGQSVKTHNHLMLQYQGNMINPTNGVQQNSQKI